MRAVSLHNHTYRCQHSEGDACDYADYAAGMGVEVLGMSDHCPLPDRRSRYMRMGLEEEDGYIGEVMRARALYPGLKVLLGVECDFLPEHLGFLSRHFTGLRGYDYACGSVHFVDHGGRRLSTHYSIDSPEALDAYARLVVTSIESGLFDFICHPDLFGCSYLLGGPQFREASRTICEAGRKRSAVFELNTSGFQKEPVTDLDGRVRAPYPLDEFWETASEYGIEVLVSSDAHVPALVGDLDPGYAYAERFGLRLTDMPRLH